MRNAYLQMCDYGSRFRILKGGKISLVVSAFIASTTLLHAAPSGGVVTSGSATIAQSGSVTNINQSSQKASINWTSFSIAPSETVNFNQPNVSSVTLNRVIGNEKSIIEGALNANGQVFILNSNGVLFTKNASINTAGLVASTMNLSDADFQAGNYAFKGDSTASIINQGTINISDKGYAALFGKEVRNEGIIRATLGKAELVGAKEVTLNLNGNSLVNLKVDKGVLDALVENKGAIYADGGEVYLTTNAVNDLLKGVVNNTGVIEANSIDDLTGKVELFAHGGTANVGGTIKAEGGFVETSGKEFVIQPNATIKAKQWLIDPVSITIDDMLAGTISKALQSGDVTITTDGDCTGVTCSGSEGVGDITVNSMIRWVTSNTLTLSAYRNIYFNAVVSVDGTGSLILNYRQGGVVGDYTFGYNSASGSAEFAGRIDLSGDSHFQTKQGNYDSIDWTVISYVGSGGDELTPGMKTLQGLAHSSMLNGNYVLGSNINASDTEVWNTDAGFKPIGDQAEAFTGHFDGLGHSIKYLKIDRPTEDTIGLFGKNSGTIQNVALRAAQITGNSKTGALVGQNGGTIRNAIVGAYDMDGSFVTGNGESTGGLVGLNYFRISNSSAQASVSGQGYSTGGLVGTQGGGNSEIANSWATGSTKGTDNVGGLVGSALAGNIRTSWSGVDVAGGGEGTGVHIGGLVGHMEGPSYISDVYAMGSVSGVDYVGGLVGSNTGYMIATTYATGLVTSEGTHVGGLFGTTNSDVLYSFWDTEKTGQATGGGVGIGKTTAQMSDIATFGYGWRIRAGDGINNPYPSLTMSDTYDQGTIVWTIPVASTTTTPTVVVATTTPDVAHIVNNNAITVRVPSFTPPVVPVQAPQQFNFGGQTVELMSTPNKTGETPTKVVSLTDVKEMQSEKGNVNGGNNEIRVPLMAGSLIDLVNGGVKLPAGVEQEFFMAQK